MCIYVKPHCEHILERMRNALPSSLLQGMDNYGNPNVSDLHHVPVFSSGTPPGLLYNTRLASRSPDTDPSSSNPGINVGLEDQGQVDSTSTAFFEIEDDFSVDWDRIDMEEKQEKRHARKRFMDRMRHKRLSKGFDVLRSLLPGITSTKKNLEFELISAVDYMKVLKQGVEKLHEELQAAQPCNYHLPMDMTTSLFSPLSNFDGDQPTVEVIAEDNGSVNIHMSCEYRPGILHSVMSSIDHLKIDVQEAIITCFDGFKLDILNAKQCNGQFLKAEDIKSVLMLCAAQGA